MAGFIIIKTTKSLTLGDMRGFIAKANARNLPPNTQVLIGYKDGELTLAIPADLHKTVLPPAPVPKTKQTMRHAKRRTGS